MKNTVVKIHGKEMKVDTFDYLGNVLEKIARTKIR
jgi:hypothetical protein